MDIKSTMQELFCNEYIIDYHATNAAKRAGYSEKSAQQISSVLMKEDKIQNRIAELSKDRFDRLKITQDKVILEIANIAFFDARKLLNEDGTPKAISQLDDNTASAIGGLDVMSIGDNTHISKYKIVDKNSALEKLCKHFSLYAPEKREVEITNNVMKVPVSSEEDWEEMAEKSQEELVKQNG